MSNHNAEQSVRTMLAEVGFDVVEVVALTGGTFNTVYRVGLADADVAVLKVPPARNVPILRYERGILRSEADFYRLVGQRTSVPVPEVRHVGTEPEFLLMSCCPGQSWAELPADGAERDRLRYELGGLVAELHTIAGTDFGYPAESVAALDRSWRGAFLAMVDSVLADAARFGVRLPAPEDRIRRVVEDGSDVLDEVRTPVLTHFDLWDGNILLLDGRISGVVDGERAFWGDPAADFVSLALFGDLEADRAFLAGYRAGGGEVEFDPALRRRLRLYHLYLDLIMYVETTPRGYEAQREAALREFVGRHLVATVSALDQAFR